VEEDLEQLSAYHQFLARRLHRQSGRTLLARKQSAINFSDNYRTETAEIKVPVVAPQWVIILGASLGAIIAYFLLPNIRRKPDHVELLGLSSAILFGIIITILLGRIADTQFFVKITVTDFWGAVAIGFIGVASGHSLLQKYLPSWGAPTNTANNANVSPTAAMTALTPGGVTADAPAVVSGAIHESE
jgi:hypothetical protein